jgi:hypothetical protein
MTEHSVAVIEGRTAAMADWYALLRDQEALMAMPGAHHKALLKRAHTMHRAHLIGVDDLCELLEFADAALMFAIESLLDLGTNQ